MGVFDNAPLISEPLRDADALDKRIQNGVHTVYEFWREAKAALWGRPDWTVADAQARIDALGPKALPLFQLSAAIGTLLHQFAPELVTANDIAPPVAFTLVAGHIVLDPAAHYPTEAAAVEPTPNLPPMPEPPNN